MVRVIGVGDNTVDQYLHLGMMFPGGNAVNVAVLAQRYGHPASYLGWFGNDVYGHLLLRALEDEGLDISHCRVMDGPNARGEVTVVDGDRVFGPATHGVTTQIDLTPDDLEYIGQHDLLHTSIYSHLERQLPELSQTTPVLAFDFSSDWKRDYLAECLPWVNIALLSYPDREHEAVEDIMRLISAQGPRLVLVTQGKDGATVFDGARFYHQGIVDTEVVDTLGAGDSFAARFLVEHLGGVAIQQAMSKAAESAAETCRYYGAFGHGMPIPQ